MDARADGCKGSTPRGSWPEPRGPPGPSRSGGVGVPSGVGRGAPGGGDSAVVYRMNGQRSMKDLGTRVKTHFQSAKWEIEIIPFPPI